MHIDDELQKENSIRGPKAFAVVLLGSFPLLSTQLGQGSCTSDAKEHRQRATPTVVAGGKGGGLDPNKTTAKNAGPLHCCLPPRSESAEDEYMWRGGDCLFLTIFCSRANFPDKFPSPLFISFLLFLTSSKKMLHYNCIISRFRS